MRRRRKERPFVTLPARAVLEAAADYERVRAAAAAELAARRLCGATEGAALCHLDADGHARHRARVGDRVVTPQGVRRNVIEWGRK